MMTRPPVDSGKRGLGLRDMFILLAGACVGLFVFRPMLLVEYDPEDGGPIEVVPVAVRVVAAVLGGISLVGVPLLLLRGHKSGPWGAGKLAWFAHGMSSWLLWPPIVVWQGSSGSRGPWSAICWLWGTPLMGIYVTASLVAGGWLGRRGRRRLQRSWQEQFGILLACMWACTGLYLLYLLYSIDVLRKQ